MISRQLAFASRLVAVALLAPLLLWLGGCPSTGGGATDNSVTIAGTLSNGFTVGEGITAQHASEAPLGVQADRQGAFRLNIEGKTGPFLLRGLMRSQGVFHSVATQPGVVNVTPLTELTVAMLRGEPPTLFYDTLASGDANLSEVTETEVVLAEQRVRRLLLRQLNVQVPAGIASFVRTPFTALNGDPMHDTLRTVLNAVTATRQTFPDFVGEVADESRRCKTEAVAVSLGDASDELCPASKSTGPDSLDSSITRYQFTSALGDVLVVRVRDGNVISTEYGRNNVIEYDCQASTCSGIALGTPAGDGSRRITLTSARLAARQGTGSAVLNGAAQSGDGPVPLVCLGTRVSTVFSDGGTDLQCVARRFTTRKAARTSYAFLSKSTLPWLLNVIAEGERVVWVSIDDPLLNGNPASIRYRCKNSACAGVTLAAADAQGHRTLTLSNTTLSKVNADGSLSSTEQARVSAVLETLAPIAVSSTCEEPVRIALDHSDGTHEDLCLSSFSSFIPNDNDGDGVVESVSLQLITTIPASEVLDTLIEAAEFDSATGAVQSIQLSRPYVNAGFLNLFLNPVVQYRCVGAACAGFSITPFGDSYQAQFNGTVLQEIDPDGGIGDRTLTINGTMP